jgi:hypothetical protein
VVTRAGPFALPERENIIIVVTPELHRQLGKLDTISFFGVALGFLDLAYQARLHAAPYQSFPDSSPTD